MQIRSFGRIKFNGRVTSRDSSFRFREGHILNPIKRSRIPLNSAIARMRLFFPPACHDEAWCRVSADRHADFLIDLQHYFRVLRRMARAKASEREKLSQRSFRRPADAPQRIVIHSN